MVSNCRRSSQAWKKRLRHWTYTCTFVAFLDIHTFFLFFFPLGVFFVVVVAFVFFLFFFLFVCFFAAAASKLNSSGI